LSPESQSALGLAEFVHYGLPWAIVICSRQSMVEVVLARALRELAPFRALRFADSRTDETAQLYAFARRDARAEATWRPKFSPSDLPIFL
jgi:hypothetical protein